MLTLSGESRFYPLAKTKSFCLRHPPRIRTRISRPISSLSSEKRWDTTGAQEGDLDTVATHHRSFDRYARPGGERGPCAGHHGIFGAAALN